MTAPHAPRLLADRYTLGVVLGSGSFATVYAAADRLGSRPVAIKVFPPNAPLAALRRERAALRGLHLPGVVALLDEGSDEGQDFLVMERVDGLPFPGGPCPAPWSAVVAPLVALLEVLGAFHAAGAVHLDLKPAHVLVNPDGGVVLLDLGLSRGRAVERDPGQAGGGNERYAAPEQILHDPLDARTDLYAVGLMAYEAIFGVLPHDSHAARVRRVTPPVRARLPELPAPLALLIDRLLARDPADRPASADDALRLLGPIPTPWLDALCPAEGPPLTERDCVAFFAGPSHFLRLPERAAGELWRRTGGAREAVRAELRVWRSLGLARRSGDRLLIDHDGLARLRYPTWSRLSGPPGEGPPTLTARDCLQMARDRFQSGEVNEAEAMLVAALAEHDPDIERAILGFWLRVALADGTPGMLDRLCAQLDRHPAPLGPIDRLARAAALAAANAGIRAIEGLGAPPDSGEPELRLCYLMVLLHAAENAGEQAQSRALDEARAMLDEDPEMHLRFDIGKARLFYMRGLYVEAARLHECTIDRAPTRSGRIAAMLNAANCWLEAAELAACARLAVEALQLAEAHQLPVYACRATYFLRAATWRSGEVLTPEPALLDAAEAVGVPLCAGMHGLGEAVFAWRAGDSALAIQLARRAHRAFLQARSRGGKLLSHALLVALASDAALARALAAEVLAKPLADFDWQILGLLAPWLDAQQRDRARLLIGQTPHPQQRRELLSPHEALNLFITTDAMPATYR